MLGRDDSIARNSDNIRSMATSSSLHAESRRLRLLEILDVKGRITITETANELEVSLMTLRRDLSDLEAEGRLRRVRGGAVAPSEARSFKERNSRRTSAKRVIAQKAQSLVPNEGTCAFDASSTSGVLLSGIEHATDLTVVTNSAHNFETAASRPGVAALLVGGHRQALTNSFVGPLADLLASSLTYNKFFTSAASLDLSWGSSEATPEEAALKRTLVKQAESTVLLLDSSKLDARAVARSVSLEDVEFLVTELEPSDPRLDSYRNAVEIL